MNPSPYTPRPTEETPVASPHTLQARGLELGYGERRIVSGLDVDVPPGAITVVVGPNACGKSTLLRSMARLLTPADGAVLLDGREVHKMATKDVAAVLGVLPQTPVAPESITVADLVGRGRYPHQGWFRRWTAADDAAVATALHATDVLDLADRPIDELSGGQRQRVWIAMALAQETDVLLLDEPTTYLDISHQLDVLDLLTDLNRERGVTLVVVLHDLNLACRYADHLIAMKDGRVVAEGAPSAIVTESLVDEVFGLRSTVVPDPVSGTPLIVPMGRHHSGSVTP
ncbi:MULTISPECIES: ABC transporter ATP-binding protein [unclassified Streptomyces]|uniref:ABC transporter ATP-binding protein n=1 Tax=Streptomyces sp. SID8367 TaxID=2690349 RepID=UPI000DB9FA81|nr:MULTISPECIES: ABC transporter ATP-binding protein [unclassified Streptomyces]MYT74501.1 ATP-binding cassette domain-containing protein [Streptomyces sp. SID8367]RAJ91481.1 iron complex transport system ATP-binding protein [Streptomyces sp. PsTaAH-137]